MTRTQAYSSKSRFDFVVPTTIIRGEKANRGVEAIPSANPHQMNRIVGFLPDGTKVLVAQREGRGGMDFNKLMGGKVYAVAADGFSPVKEKGPDGKATGAQKLEDGLPLYSSSGFYSLSNKDYPALDIRKTFMRLLPSGEQMLLVAPEALDHRQVLTLSSDLDVELLLDMLAGALDDSANLVAEHDAAINKKRELALRRAREDAEANSEDFTGPAFEPCLVSKKDGNPLVLLVWKTESGSVDSATIARETEVVDPDTSRPVMKYLTAREAVDNFQLGKAFQRLSDEVAAGRSVQLTYVVGHIMRCSVSFRRKVQEVFQLPKEKPLFGDAAFIRGARDGWVLSIVSILHSQHPQFPREDYEVHHYVAMAHQGEIGMSKKTEGTGWLPPSAVTYDLRALMLERPTAA